MTTLISGALDSGALESLYSDCARQQSSLEDNLPAKQGRAKISPVANRAKNQCDIIKVVSF